MVLNVCLFSFSPADLDVRGKFGIDSLLARGSRVPKTATLRFSDRRGHDDAEFTSRRQRLDGRLQGKHSRGILV